MIEVLIMLEDPLGFDFRTEKGAIKTLDGISISKSVEIRYSYELVSVCSVLC